MNDAEFATVADLLRARSGLTVGPEKRYLVETRLAPLLKAHNLTSLGALARALTPGARAAPALADAVVEAMTTNESFFFRDGKPFEHLRRALPALAQARPPGAKLRIWSAAASTGQELYSIAMIVADSRAQLGGRDVELIGTDIAQAPLSRAREGLYSQFEVQRGLPVQMLMRHFAREGESWRVSEALRGMTRFSTCNLLHDLRPLGTFDVVFCRNVLIYFDAPTKARVFAALAERLAPDGVLYLGAAETVFGITDRLAPLPDERGVYGRVG